MGPVVLNLNGYDTSLRHDTRNPLDPSQRLLSRHHSSIRHLDYAAAHGCNTYMVSLRQLLLQQTHESISLDIQGQRR